MAKPKFTAGNHKRIPVCIPPLKLVERLELALSELARVMLLSQGPMKTKALLVLLCIAAFAASWNAFHHSKPAAAVKQPLMASAGNTRPEAAKQENGAPEKLDLQKAIDAKRISGEFIGNGRERMKGLLTSLSNAPITVRVPAGQVFESDHNRVVVTRTAEMEIGAGKTREVSIQTAATRSSNVISDVPYEISYLNVPRIEPLLQLAQNRPELTAPTMQTAILALTENLPLSAVAKFTLASTPLPSRFNTDPFRAETVDIITALATLRELRFKDESLAITIDPQLRIEAMIDPAARPIAMQYYEIDPEREWDFWRNELLNGEPTTRHYALYGIARFYPDVALQMLPRWARETRTNPVYRLSAVQALADTQRGEALVELRKLTEELGRTTELGKAASRAGDYLDYRLNQIAAMRSSVAFRNAGM